MECPLCTGDKSQKVVHSLREAPYYICEDCDLIFVDADYHLSPEAEKSRYLTHENHIGNEGYLQFLRPAVEKMKEIFSESKNVLGLDYGSGPNPVLAELLVREGFNVDTYDPYFSPKQFTMKYKFIISTEVFEHFKNPRKELMQIQKILEGPLVVLTQLHAGPMQFRDWWYAKDPTHVVFYSEKTFDWIRKEFSLDVRVIYNKQR